MQDVIATRSTTTKRARYIAPSDVQHCGPDRLGKLTATEALLAPQEFWAAGHLDLLDANQKRVAVIGSRDASEAGIKRAAVIAQQLAQRGFVVVSGLAKGIDRAAHEGCMAAGGRTIAVIGTPIDKAYPTEHSPIQQFIAKDHLLLSQFPEGARTYPSDFVKRNRFMALISHATVIVEAGDGSGTLSQASETVQLGHPLFIMASMFEKSDLKWPRDFLHPKKGQPAIKLTSVDQIAAALT